MSKLSFKDGAGHWQPISGGGWSRPLDWLPTNVVAGEQKIQMLVAIGVAGTPEPFRTAAISATGGAFTVDWGDGTAPQNFAASADALHLYNPAALAGTLTSEGFLQALITITPQAGQTLNTVTPCRPYYTGKNARSNVVEIVVGPVLSNIGIVGANMPILQRVVFLSPYRPISLTTQFTSCAGLREVIGTIESIATSANGMFNGCTLLENASGLTISAPSVTTATSMFFGCAAMVTAPALSLPALTSIGTMFQGCRSLLELPALNWSIIQVWSAAFQECASLTALPSDFTMAAATVCASTFQDCSSLAYANVPTPLSTNNQAMFLRCASLREVVAQTPLITAASNMFSGCFMLEKITGLDFSNVLAVNLSATFSNCYRLATLGFAAGKGPAFSFTVANTNLAAAELNAVYAALPTVSAQTITVTGVPGGLGDDPTIATAKGWTVTGS